MPRTAQVLAAVPDFAFHRRSLRRVGHDSGLRLGGPLPISKEAAETFGKARGIDVQVTAGPKPCWIDTVHSGCRSALAAKSFDDMGLGSVSHVAGGVLALEKAGAAVDPA